MYIGTRLVRGYPMTRQEYNDLRGWVLPSDENGSDAGYLVEYADGGPSNHPDYVGYISWSPVEVFEAVYRQTTGMSFGLALEALKHGKQVARAGWNGKNMFIFLVPGSQFTVNRPPLLGIYPEGTQISYSSHIDMRTADGTIIPWNASHADMLAGDWMIV